MPLLSDHNFEQVSNPWYKINPRRKIYRRSLKKTCSPSIAFESSSAARTLPTEDAVRTIKGTELRGDLCLGDQPIEPEMDLLDYQIALTQREADIVNSTAVLLDFTSLRGYVAHLAHTFCCLWTILD